MTNRRSKTLTYILHDAVTMLMMVNLAVFLLVHLAAVCGVDSMTLAQAVAMPADIHALLTHPWTAFVYMFVQWDFFHLAFNMLWLWTFGFMAYRLGCRGKTLVTAYIAGGLAGAATFALIGLTEAAHGSLLLGSSAAVLSVVGLLGIIYGDMRVQLMLIGTVRVRWLCAGVIALVLLTSAGGGSVATPVAHVAGALAGIVMALVMKHRAGRPNIIRPMNAPQNQPYLHRGAAYGPGQKHGLTPAEQAELDDLLVLVRRDGYAGMSADARRRLFELTAKIK